MAFEQRIKDLRLKRRFSMQEVAIRIGLAKSSYAGYEGGYRHPPMEKLIALAKLYQVSTDYLLGLTDISDPYPPISTNAKDILGEKYLHWDGIPLSEDDQAFIKQLLEMVIQRKKTDKNSSTGG